MLFSTAIAMIATLGCLQGGTARPSGTQTTREQVIRRMSRPAGARRANTSPLPPVMCGSLQAGTQFYLQQVAANPNAFDDVNPSTVGNYYMKYVISGASGTRGSLDGLTAGAQTQTAGVLLEFTATCNVGFVGTTRTASVQSDTSVNNGNLNFYLPADRSPGDVDPLCSAGPAPLYLLTCGLPADPRSIRLSSDPQILVYSTAYFSVLNAIKVQS